MMAAIGFHASHEQVLAERAASRRPRRRGRRFRARHVLRPLFAVERAAGRVGLRVVVAGGGAAGHVAAVRRGERARAALSPGRDRAGRGDALRAVPGPVLVGARHGGVLERAHHRRTLARQAHANARLAECVDGDACVASRARSSTTTGWCASTARGCGPCRPSPPPLIGAAVSAETAAWVASWADGLITIHAAAGAARARARGVPRQRRRGQDDRRSGASLVGARRRRGAARSPTTSGGRTSSARRCAGISRPSSSSTRPRVTCAPRTSARRCSSPPISGATRPGCTSWPSWAGTRCTCTTSDATSAPSSRPSASTSCPSSPQAA